LRKRRQANLCGRVTKPKSKKRGFWQWGEVRRSACIGESLSHWNRKLEEEESLKNDREKKKVKTGILRKFRNSIKGFHR